MKTLVAFLLVGVAAFAFLFWRKRRSMPQDSSEYLQQYYADKKPRRF